MPQGRHWQQHTLLGAAILAAALVAVSCGGPDREPVYHVRGQVLFHGKPALNAFVVFHPLTAGERLSELRPAGRVGPGGWFTLKTYTQDDGAPAGDYQVTVGWPELLNQEDGELADPDTAAFGPDRLRGRYANPEDSGLTATVVPGENVLPPFEIE